MDRSVYFLSVAQAGTVTIAVLSVTISASLGEYLSSSETLSTVPYGIQFLALLVTAVPIARCCSLFGRKLTLMTSLLIGAGGCLCAAAAAAIHGFALFCAAHALLGIGLGAGNLYRFCALEVCTPDRREKALSLVMSGGIAAAILGPSMSRMSWSVGRIGRFTLIYGAGAVLFLLAASLVCLSTLSAASEIVPVMPGPPERKNPPPDWKLGMGAGAVGYLFMNLLMIECPMALMKKGLSLGTMSYMIELHVLGMFAPSFLSGKIIHALGARSVVGWGGALLAVCGLTPLVAMNGAMAFIVLLLLGIAWNFLYVGGSHLVSCCEHRQTRIYLQGRNELAVGTAAMIGAFLPGMILGCDVTSLMFWACGLAGIGLCCAGFFRRGNDGMQEEPCA